MSVFRFDKTRNANVLNSTSKTIDLVSSLAK